MLSLPSVLSWVLLWDQEALEKSYCLHSGWEDAEPNERGNTQVPFVSYPTTISRPYHNAEPRPNTVYSTIQIRGKGWIGKGFGQRFNKVSALMRLVQVYDQLAEATGRSRDQLFVEALRLYARTEGRQITEVQRTLTSLEAGTLETVAGDKVTAQFLAEGRITHASLAEAGERYVPPEQQTR